MTTSHIEQRVESALPGARARARDLTGGGDHFELIVIAESFRGQSLVDRHRRVYAALAEEMKGPIHALTLKTYSPDEAEPS